MKHATAAALDRLEPLLAELRAQAPLKEKSRGTFYLRGRAFLHFHEHGSELFADVRLKDGFDRFPATTPSERADLMKKIAVALTATPAQSRP